MRIGWLGVVLLYAGLFMEVVTANPWGEPAMQPWFTVGGFIAGLGVGILMFTLQRLEKEAWR